MPTAATAVVVGGGPGGLMAAEVLAGAGVQVTVFEHRASVGRTLLLAGRSGLNLTNSEPLPALIDRFGAAGERLAPALTQFGPDHLRSWAAGLGEETFVGSSGRVFPASTRATPLLRAWLARLKTLGVVIETRTRWLGSDAGRSTIERADGTRTEVSADVTILALGGASWPGVGSGGEWVSALRDAGVAVHDLRPANVGLLIPWTPDFTDRHSWKPLKNVAVAVVGSNGPAVRGDVMITATGLEGGPIYTVSSAVRDIIDNTGEATLLVDLHPDLDAGQVAERLGRRRPKDSTSNALRRTLGLTATTVAWLREVVPGALPAAPDALAALVKAVPLSVLSVAPIDRAISSAGGVDLGEVDDDFMLHRLPGTFVVGEMLDWDAPTGGYLLQATFSTGVAAARGALDRLVTLDLLPVYDEIDAGDTLWRFDRQFLGSRWMCIWGRGCQGIDTERAPERKRGCCSVGAELDGEDEARNLSALADTLSPSVFQHHTEAATGGIFRSPAADATRVVDGACIFLNRPGFVGGEGCALHLAASEAGESPIDWKPSVCWQLPLKVEWEMRDDNVEVATVRRWERRDWGEDGDIMAWCCTEEPEAYVGGERVLESLADELSEIAGAEVFVELRRRWTP